VKLKQRLLSILLSLAAAAACLSVPVSASAAPAAAVTPFTVDGVTWQVPVYVFDQCNYVRLRDLAYVLNGTQGQFSVGWNGTAAVACQGQSYTPVGDELGDLSSGSVQCSMTPLYLDGCRRALTGYTIGGSNYYALRDLAAVLDISLNWDGAGVVIQTDQPYEEPARGSSGLNTYPLTLQGRTFGEICRILPYLGLTEAHGGCAMFDYHGATLYLGFWGVGAGETPGDSAVCSYLGGPLSAFVNGCPSWMELEEERTRFGHVEVTQDGSLYDHTLFYGAYYSPIALVAQGIGKKAIYGDTFVRLKFMTSSAGTLVDGNIHFTDGLTQVVYFNQVDSRYRNQPYGTDNVGGYACGPSAMSIVISSLTDQTVDPATMARWAYENGYWCRGGGSYHGLIPGAAKAWGLSVWSCPVSQPQRILEALEQGKLVVALMGQGYFSDKGHYVVLRGVRNGKILIADPVSYGRSLQEWDLSILLSEAKIGASAGGPFWVIG
jgi:hypothetical protein